MSVLPRDRVSRVVMITFMAVIGVFMVGMFWIGEDSQRREQMLAREVLKTTSKHSVGKLIGCFGPRLSMSKFWKGEADEPGGIRGFNHMTDIGVVIRDLGDSRRVAITTSKGRALRKGEIEVIERCVG